MPLKIAVVFCAMLLAGKSYCQRPDSVFLSKKIKRAEKKLDLATVEPLLFFKIENMGRVKGRAVCLYARDGLLQYVFIDSTGTVEFSYPRESDEETPGFAADTSGRESGISFANKSASYRVYERAKTIGVEATIGGILYEQIGILSSKKGSIRDILKAKLDNVIIR